MSIPKRMATTQRHGFTIVELLVVIAIISILVALLLPAIQAAREAARVLQCKNNLHQIGLAMLQHETAHQVFPAGGWSPAWLGDPNNGVGAHQPGGWIYQSLSFLEQQQIADLGSGLTGDALKAALSEQGQSVIPSFYCPSRRPVRLYEGLELITENFNRLNFVAKTDYAANGGSDVNVKGSQSAPTSRRPFVTSECSWGYPNCNWMNREDWLVKYWDGVVGDHIGARMVQVTDGASNTLLAGEKWLYQLYYDTLSVDDPYDNATNQMPADNPGDNGPMYVGYDYDTVRACGNPKRSFSSVAAYRPRRDSEYDLRNSQRDKKGAHFRKNFGGPHVAGVIIVKCDGAVDTWSFDVDPYVWARLGVRDDDEI